MRIVEYLFFAASTVIGIGMLVGWPAVLRRERTVLGPRRSAISDELQGLQGDVLIGLTRNPLRWCRKVP